MTDLDKVGDEIEEFYKVGGVFVTGIAEKKLDLVHALF